MSGSVIKYVVGGYVVVVVLVSLLVVGSGGLFALTLLAALAGVWLARRVRGSITLDAPDAIPPLETLEPLQPLPPALPPVTPSGVAVLRRRIDALAPEFPETFVESPLLVGVAELYEHEPLEDRKRLEAEYGEQRRRLFACRDALDGGEPSERLLPAVEGVEAYADELRALAGRAGDDPVAAALEAAGRASDELADARAVLDGVAEPDRSELSTALEAADAKLRAAQAAFPKGAERPLLALRLADEAERTAADVRRRAQRLGGLPEQLDRRLHEFDRAAQRLKLELSRVKDEFRTASQQYAPSSWADVRGVGASAEQAAERARRYRSTAAAKVRSSPAEAKEELDEAFRALERSQSLARKISDHLARLEEASLTARDTLASAEEAVEASSAGGAADAEAAERAEELLARARAEAGHARPDWLRIVELAKRARRLAEGVPEPAPDPVSGDAAELLDAARAGAKDARDNAWAYGLVSPEIEAAARPMLDEVEALYQAAVDADGAARTGEQARVAAAIAAYRSAEQHARAAGERIAEIYAESIARRSRRVAEALPQSEAERVVWGALSEFGGSVGGAD